VPPSNSNPSPDQLRTFIIGELGTGELQQAVSPDTGSDAVINSNVVICYNPASGNPEDPPQIGDSVTVTIAAPYSFPVVSGLIGLAGSLFGSNTDGVGDITLRGKSTMRLEQAPQDTRDWVPCDDDAPTAPALDSTPPNPDTLPTGATATFAFHDTSPSPDDGTTFRCSIDNGPYELCTSPKQYTNLAGGGASHTFRVLAHDRLKQISSATVYTWTIN
jgi:hypothetical protein